MGNISTKLLRLKRQLAAAEARKTYKDAERQRIITEGITPKYQSKGDLKTYYIESLLEEGNLLIGVKVPKASLTAALGGHETAQITSIGGFESLPANSAQAPQRGFAHHYCSIKVVHLRETPVAKLTPWGTRVIDRGNKISGQKSRQLPIGGNDMKEVNLIWSNIEAIITSTAKPCKVYLLGLTNDIIDSKSLS